MDLHGYAVVLQFSQAYTSAFGSEGDVYKRCVQEVQARCIRPRSPTDVPLHVVLVVAPAFDRVPIRNQLPAASNNEAHKRSLKPGIGAR